MQNFVAPVKHICVSSCICQECCSKINTAFHFRSVIRIPTRIRFSKTIRSETNEMTHNPSSECDSELNMKNSVFNNMKLENEKCNSGSRTNAVPFEADSSYGISIKSEPEISIKYEMPTQEGEYNLKFCYINAKKIFLFIG